VGEDAESCSFVLGLDALEDWLKRRKKVASLGKVSLGDRSKAVQPCRTRIYAEALDLKRCLMRNCLDFEWKIITVANSESHETTSNRRAKHKRRRSVLATKLLRYIAA